ncbi:lactonase family protein [Cryptosporangium aurantiacum]|uniref:6-phosphogluconolactonase, cycloisomerase 2 family n=1 Tax=Cryptosporangium aurantiacum TaxID=134849 RepID=A0A1M7QSY1_9ACTN|nr:lactonase family protein [Cryptosporangium aurantiacum]SHN34529.1 6-phosphogluconolactonase, cycloisomerase 2 family [Cryptosporangium aurantiacum]
MTRLVIGSYTSDMGGQGAGLTALPGGPSVATASPSFVITDGSVLYAVNEGDGTVSSYAADTLALLSTQSTGGQWPCHLTLTDGHLLAANYGSGSVSVHPVDGGVIGARTDLVQHSGSGPRTDRQEGPHAHQVVVSDDGTVTVVDLGIDRLVHYWLTDGTLDQTGETVLPAGTGPRHVAIHPSGDWYLAGELSSTVLTLVDGVVIAETPATAVEGANQPSAIALSPDGQYLYLANRGPDTITTFRLDAVGVPEPIAEVPTGGHWPRDFALVDGGLVVTNERSHTLVRFRLEDGIPVPTGEVIEIGSPTCVLPG